MWIETTNRDSAGNPVTRRLTPSFLDEPVAFTENGRAQVTKDVGEALIAEYDTIRSTDASDSDSDDEAGEPSASDADSSDAHSGEDAADEPATTADTE